MSYRVAVRRIPDGGGGSIEVHDELPVGTCRSRVLDGDAEHRDALLTDSERANGMMLVCISRAAGDRLVLDL